MAEISRDGYTIKNVGIQTIRGNTYAVIEGNGGSTNSVLSRYELAPAAPNALDEETTVVEHRPGHISVDFSIWPCSGDDGRRLLERMESGDHGLRFPCCAEFKEMRGSWYPVAFVLRPPVPEWDYDMHNNPECRTDLVDALATMVSEARPPREVMAAFYRFHLPKGQPHVTSMQKASAPHEAYGTPTQFYNFCRRLRDAVDWASFDKENLNEGPDDE